MCSIRNHHMNLATLPPGHAYGRMRNMYTVATLTAAHIPAVAMSCPPDGGVMCRKSSTKGTVKYLHAHISPLEHAMMDSAGRLACLCPSSAAPPRIRPCKRQSQSPELDKPGRRERDDGTRHPSQHPEICLLLPQSGYDSCSAGQVSRRQKQSPSRGVPKEILPNVKCVMPAHGQ